MTSAVLQWLAFSTMLVDHIGYTFFPSLPVLRAVGRISFPIFALLLRGLCPYLRFKKIRRAAFLLWMHR